MKKLSWRLLAVLLIVVGLCLAVAWPLVAQKKEDERLANSATVLQQILSENNGLPRSILDQADCVLIFPSVKKLAIGFGGSYGRGALVCRDGAKMNGAWGARRCTRSTRAVLVYSSGLLRLISYWW